MARIYPKNPIEIPINNITLKGILSIPDNPIGLVVFAHGAGSSRLSPRNQYVADFLLGNNIATLLFDLLTESEDSTEKRFYIDLLADRLTKTLEWVAKQTELKEMPIGLFGASTGSAAALIASTMTNLPVRAIVSRGGRPDLAISYIDKITAPTLFIVGGDDIDVLILNQIAFNNLNSPKQFEVIPGATHLFEEPGTLEQVADLAKDWFLKYFNQ